MGLTLAQAVVNANVVWTAQQALTGSNYQPVNNSGTLNPNMSYSQAIANNLEGGANQIVSYIINIAISSNTTVDLTAITNILQQTGIVLTCVKAYMIRLLSVADDPVYGTLCSSITWGNAASNSQQLALTAGSAANIVNGGTEEYLDESAGGFIVNGTNKILKFVNNDATAGGTGPTSHIAAIQLTIIGGN